jgi:hypothetical protein
VSGASSLIGWSGLIGAVCVIGSAPGATAVDVAEGLLAFGLLWLAAASVDTDDDGIW